MNFLVFSSILFLSNLPCLDAKVLSNSISTNTGRLKGHLVEIPDSNRHDVYEFSSIPFAEPPVGNKRFKKPTPKAKWAEELLATSLPNQCPQLALIDPNTTLGWSVQEVETSEDCLYLNIWVRKSSLENGESLPVYFWIHGGGYQIGSTTPTVYNGTMLASLENIVVVSMQYRLGPLGFSYLSKDTIPGNMALWDLLEALKWTHENIVNFGGDPGKITIGGESAGAGATTVMLLSPHARSYVDQGYVSSGSALGSWSSISKEQAAHRTTQLVTYLAGLDQYKETCGQVETDEQKLNCLISSDAMDLAEGQYHVLQVDSDVQTFGIVDPNQFPPVVDGDFLPDIPANLVANDEFLKVPVLSGNVKDEGSYQMLLAPIGIDLLPTSQDELEKPLDNFTMETYNQFIDSYFVYYPSNGMRILPNVRQAIGNFYWRSENDTISQPPMNSQTILDRVIAMLGDIMLHCPTLHWSDAYSKHCNVYHFQFSHRTKDQNDPQWTGVWHSSEIPYFFGDPWNEIFQIKTYTESEKTLSLRMMQYLANFLRSGNPNVADSTLENRLDLPEWPKYKSGLGPSLVLDRDGTKGNLIHSLKSRDCEFWMNFLTKMDARIRGHYENGISEPTCPYP